MNIFEIARHLRDKGIKQIVITSDLFDKEQIEFMVTETYGTVTEYKAKDTDTMFSVTGNLVQGER